MNIRTMLRQYVQFQPRTGISRPTNAKQDHPHQLTQSDAIHWKIDFERALASLDYRDRTLLLLIHGAGYTAVEAAAITGISKRTIARRLYDGEQRLELAIQDQAEIPPRTRCRSQYTRRYLS